MADLVEQLNKVATCIYIAADETVANDIAKNCREAAASITRLTQERDAAVAREAVVREALSGLLETNNITEWSKAFGRAFCSLADTSPRAEAMLAGIEAARRWEADLSRDCDSEDRDALKAALCILYSEEQK